MTSLHQCLAEAKDSSGAIAAIYRQLKEEGRKVSLAGLCRKAGIPSKGYLSLVVNGRRLLSERHVDGLIRALALDVLPAQCLRLLVARDHAEGDARERLERELALVRKTLRISVEKMPSGRLDAYFAFEVYCALGLFKNNATVEDLTGYFGETSAVEVTAALNRLLSWGLVSEDAGRYAAGKDQVIFKDSRDGLSHFGFLKSALRDAESRLHRWYERRGESFIESVILSVDKRRYEELLPEIRAAIHRFQSDLESPDADMLVRLNVQIYPAR